MSLSVPSSAYRQYCASGQRRVASTAFKYLLVLMIVASPSAGALPLRIVSLTPQATEIIFQLGKGSSVVATSDYSDSISDAKNVPRLGHGITPSLERIIHFNPDWVVGNLGANRRELLLALRALGIRFFSFNISSLDELVSESSLFLRQVFFETHNANLERFKKCMMRLKPRAKFPFLAFAWAEPTVLFGHQTLLSDILTRLGGKNALPPQWKIPYPQISQEWILKRSVSKIFYTSNSKDASKHFHRWWPARPTLIAMDPNTFSRASFSVLLHVNQILPGSLPLECARE